MLVLMGARYELRTARGQSCVLMFLHQNLPPTASLGTPEWQEAWQPGSSWVQAVFTVHSVHLTWFWSSGCIHRLFESPWGSPTFCLLAGPEWSQVSFISTLGVHSLDLVAGCYGSTC
jgi:hypothetical protein